MWGKKKKLWIMGRCDVGMSVATSGMKAHGPAWGKEIRGKKGCETPAAAAAAGYPLSFNDH